MRHRVPTAVRLTLIAAAIGTLSLGASARAFATDQPVDDTGGGDIVCADGTTPDTDLDGDGDGQITESDCPDNPDDTGGACAADPSSCLDASADSTTPRENESATVAAESAGTLPFTGSADGPLALAGALCIAAGAALLASQRRSDSVTR